MKTLLLTLALAVAVGVAVTVSAITTPAYVLTEQPAAGCTGRC